MQQTLNRTDTKEGWNHANLR